MSSGLQTLLYVDLHCHHNTHPRSSTADLKKGSKNTNCPSTMFVIIKRTADCRGRNRSKDKHIGQGYPTIITLKWDHNHEVASADALRERDVSDGATEKLLELYRSGHSPSSALDTIKYDLQEAADRAHCPDLQSCYRVFYKEFRTHYGDTGGAKMMLFLDKKVQDFNENHNDECVKLETTCDGQTVIAICTPLMKRVHSMWKISKEMVFVDSSGNMDRQNCRVFLLLTHSPAGALPLGVLITSSESESTLTSAFKLLHSILPESAFFNASNGPGIFMTDDCTSLRLALHEVYPNSVLLLCHFHLLQAMWRWLWDSKHKIDKNDRPHLLNIFKAMVYAETEDDLHSMFKRTTEADATSLKYPGFVAHVNEIYERRVTWSLAHRKDLRTRGNNTTAYCEAAMRILKDKIFYRLKAFNICQLTDFVLTRLENYNVRKLTDIANNRLNSNNLISRFYPCPKDVSPDAVTKLGNCQEYTVKSGRENTYYNVNMDIGICTCPIGRTGAPCKHQAAIMHKYSIESSNFLPVQSVDMRKLFYTIATGGDAIDDHWFQPLRSGILQTDNCRNISVSSPKDASSTEEASSLEGTPH
ncbi:uncharacterized protein [Antedon mediterranea]|uniref:uncharacterized protein n=1 Tax=Antedon mediterranea TaxID=105859 RepID=UPI003AF44D98